MIEINQQLGRITSAVIQDNKLELEWDDKLCDPSGATLTIQVHAINFQNGNNSFEENIGEFFLEIKNCNFFDHHKSFDNHGIKF